MKVFDWKNSKDLKEVLDKVIQIVLTKRQTTEVVKNLRELGDLNDAYSEDVLSAFASVVGHENLNEFSRGLLESHFRKEFSNVRVYHACRPVSLAPYFKYGILKSDRERLENEARIFFLSVDNSAEFVRALDQAINDFSNDAFPEHEQRVFVQLDSREFLSDSGHYLIYGSEYLLSIAAKIQPYSPRYRYALKARGIPTILECEVPFDLVRKEMKEVWKKLFLNYLLYLGGCEFNQSPIDYTMTLDHVPGELIVNHSHPTKIVDPHEGFLPYRSTKTICEFC